jgi:hypothetical protein
MHLYVVIEDQANPSILVIHSCHPNYLRHAAVCVQPLVALTGCYLLKIRSSGLIPTDPPVR